MVPVDGISRPFYSERLLMKVRGKMERTGRAILSPEVDMLLREPESAQMNGHISQT
jgi:hypothetical protein